MRVLYLSADAGIPVLGRKGASVHVRELATALARRGADVTIASPRVAPEGEALAADVSLVEISGIVPRDLFDPEVLSQMRREQGRQVLAVAEKTGAEAIYERYSLYSDAGIVAARRLGIPHVLEVNAPLRQEAKRFRSLPFPRVAADVEGRIFRATDHVFAVSSQLASALASLGVEPAKIEVVPNGVDPLKFPPRELPGGTSLIVGFAGSLKPWHGVDVLLEAVRRAIADGADLRLEIAGTGPLEPLIAAADIAQERLRRHGSIAHAEIPALLARWDVGVAPYLDVPGFYFSPLKIVEYLASGLCVVASRLGQVSWLLGGGERGVLVPAGDPAALAAALASLARDRRALELFGRRGRSWALANVTWDRNADRAFEALRAGRQRRVA